MTKGKNVKRCCSPLGISLILVILGVAIALLSIGASPLYRSVVKKKLVMKPGSTSYEDWHVAPVPVFMNYYIFNYTNVYEIVAFNATPNVTELGPYAYREHRINSIIEENADEIIYTQNYSYHFDASASCDGCSESDRFFTPNTPYLTVLQIFGSVDPGNDQSKINALNFFNKFFVGQPFFEKTFVEHNVTELLWGYTDEFLVKLKLLAPSSEFFLKILNVTVPEINEFVALQHNATDEVEFFGNFTIKTGNKDIDDVQRITQWKGEKEVKYWKNYGKMINGTDGTRFKPFVEKDDKLYTFIPDICRSLYLDYDQEDKIEGIDLYRFTTSQKLFLNASLNEDNRDFCLGGCWPTGIMPIGQCISGNPPAFASGVSFYQSDPSLFDAINGLAKPEKEKHATLLSVEPDTGTMMKVNKRLQINIRAQLFEYFTSTHCFPKDGIFLPVFYVDESVRIDDKNAQKFKDEVLKPKKDLMVYGRFSLIGVGVGMVLIGVIVFAVSFICRRRDGYEKI